MLAIAQFRNETRELIAVILLPWIYGISGLSVSSRIKSQIVRFH